MLNLVNLSTYEKKKRIEREYLEQQLDVPNNSCSKKSREQVFFKIMLSGVDI